MYALKYLAFSILLYPAFAQAQAPRTASPEEILAAINAVYANEPNIYHDLRYQLKRTPADQEIYSTESGRFIKADGNVYSALGPVKSLITDQYVVAVDEDDQILLLSGNHHQESALPLAELLAALPEEVHMEVVPRPGDTGILRMRAAYGELRSAELHYRKADHLLEKVVLHYRRSWNLATDESEDYARPTLEILYQTNHLRPGKHPETVLSNYLQYREGTWAPAPAFRQFTLINNLDPNQR